MISGLFSLRVETVARPMSVTPSSRVPLVSQRKWSVHFWVRGLNKGVSLLVCGSSPVVRVPLCSLQGSQRLSRHRPR